MKNFKCIESKDNSLIKLISLLQASAKARKENGLFVLEGLRICKDAYENGIQFDKLIFTKTAYDKFAQEILKFADNSLENIQITDALFNKISDTKSPQGIIALVSFAKVKNSKLDKNGRYIALENVQDPSNLGAVCRTAEALGVSGVIVSSNGCDPFSPKALRASMGAAFRMKLVIGADAEDAIGKLRSRGFAAYAAALDERAVHAGETTYAEKIALVIGSRFKAGPYIFFDIFLLKVEYVKLGSAGLDGLFFKTVKLGTLSNVAGNGNYFAVIVVLFEPRDDDRGIKTARIRKNNLFDL